MAHKTAEARAAYSKKWRAKNKAKERDTKLRARYGISLEEYAQRLAEQGGVCAICGRPPKEGRVLDTDHCHTTGRVRGLLCRVCNITLGRLNDDPDILRRAADYLETN